MNILPSGIIASVQAREGSFMMHPAALAEVAFECVHGGAVAVRVDGLKNVKACRTLLPRVPIIGIIKLQGQYPQITINSADIQTLLCIEADYVATSSIEALAEISKAQRKRVIFDAWNAESAFAADALEPAFITTTLSGYTPDTIHLPHDEPDLLLLMNLCVTRKTPVIAEGRYRTTDQIRQAFSFGAYAVCVGAAISRPDLIVNELVKGCTREVDSDR